MGRYEDLIAHRMDVEQMRAYMGCDTLAFLSLEGMMRAVDNASGYCQACFTGRYPIDINGSAGKSSFDQGIS